jgi:hypothetical protein
VESQQQGLRPNVREIRIVVDRRRRIAAEKIFQYRAPPNTVREVHGVAVHLSILVLHRHRIIQSAFALAKAVDNSRLTAAPAGNVRASPQVLARSPIAPDHLLAAD